MQSDALVTSLVTLPQDKKTQFVENIKKWVVLDTQLKTISERTKQMREMKQRLGSEVCDYIKENQLSDTKITITDGSLKLVEKKEYAPLTFAYIEECLGKMVSEPEHVKYMIQFLKDNRQMKTSSDIRRTYSARNV